MRTGDSLAAERTETPAGVRSLAGQTNNEVEPARAIAGPLISVVVPTLNAEKLLPACLQSLKDQTYRNIEIIVVDGHSTDRTVEITKEFTDQVHVFGPDQSKGRVYGGPYQRNYGAAHARGDYIYLVDADMELTPRVIEAAVEKIRETGADTLIIPEEFHGTTFWAKCKWLEKRCYRGDDSMEAPRLIKKQLWDAIGGVNPTMGGVEDRHMFRQLLAHGAHVERIAEIVRNNEGKLTLWGSWRKKYLYGKSALRYLRQAPPNEAYREFTVFKTAYARNWRLLTQHPLLTGGFLVLRTGEYAATALGMLRSFFGQKQAAVHIIEGEQHLPSPKAHPPTRVFPMREQKISVLMPVYNHAAVIAETLETIFAQEYGHFELILSDDCSTDNLREILERFPDPRIKVFRNERNLGYGANLEQCRQRASADADILLLVAADDLLCAGYFQTVNRVFHEYPEVGAIIRPFYLFGRSLKDPIRDFPPYDRAHNRVVSLFDGEKVLHAIFGTVVQLSGLAFRKNLVTIPFHPDTMPSHAYPFFHVLRTHNIMFLKDYAVAVRRYTSQTRRRAVYEVSPTASWVCMVKTVFPEPEFADIRRLAHRIVSQNFVGLVQLKNFSTFRVLLREYSIMIREYPKNLLHPVFWAFLLGTLLIPRSVLLPLVDWYGERVAARLLQSKQIVFVPAALKERVPSDALAR